MSCLGRARVPVILHCFEGGEREADEARERGYYVGLAGNVTYKNSETAQVLDRLDPERLLVETDAPYLSPQPVRKDATSRATSSTPRASSPSASA
jgi:TatD DNase family protein